MNILCADFQNYARIAHVLPNHCPCTNSYRFLVFNPVAPFRYLLPNLYLSVANIAIPDLIACGSRSSISLDIARFYEEHCQPSCGAVGRTGGLPKNGNRAPIAGGGRGQHNLHRVCQTSVTAPPYVGCVVWSRLCQFTTGVMSLARHGSNLPGSLSCPHNFDTSILSSNTKTQFSEICRGLILWH